MPCYERVVKQYNSDVRIFSGYFGELKPAPYLYVVENKFIQPAFKADTKCFSVTIILYVCQTQKKNPGGYHNSRVV